MLSWKIVSLTFKWDRTLSQVFMLRNLLKRKCGTSDFRALRLDVRCEKSFAYNNLWTNYCKFDEWRLNIVVHRDTNTHTKHDSENRSHSKCRILLMCVSDLRLPRSNKIFYLEPTFPWMFSQPQITWRTVTQSSKIAAGVRLTKKVFPKMFHQTQRSRYCLWEPFQLVWPVYREW